MGNSWAEVLVQGVVLVIVVLVGSSPKLRFVVGLVGNSWAEVLVGSCPRDSGLGVVLRFVVLVGNSWAEVLVGSCPRDSGLVGVS